MKKTSLFFLSFITLIISVGFSSCKGGKALELNLNEGDKFTQVITTEMDMVQNVMGQNVKVPTTTETRIHYHVDKVTEKEYTFSAVRENIKIKTGIGIASMTIDSDKEDMFNMGKIFKAMTGKTVIVSVDKHGNVLSIRGEEEIAKTLAEAVSTYFQVKDLTRITEKVQSQYSSMDIQVALEQFFFYMPAEEVKKGDSWRKNMSINNQYDLNSDVHLTLTDVKGTVGQINFEGRVSSGEEPIVQKVNGMLMELNLNGTRKGTVMVNMDSGLAEHIEIILDVKGSVLTDGINVSQNIKSKTTIITE